MKSENKKEEAMRIVWQPQEGSQKMFLSCPLYEVLYDGTRGSQKTDSLIMDFAQHVGTGLGRSWRGLIFRRTYKQLDDIIDRTKKWFFQIFPGVKYNEAKYVWTWPDGEQLLLRHMDNQSDYWNYHGHEIPFIGWEELTGWPDDKCYETMKSCCRSSDERVPRKYRATTNPWGIGMGWVKRYFVDPAPAGSIITNDVGEHRVRIHGSILENKILLDADPEYIKKLDSIKDPNKRKAWRDGSWDITAGGAFDDVWDEVRHVIEPFEIPRAWYLDRSFDWGSAKPFSVGWWAEADGTDAKTRDGKTLCFPRGTLIRIHEYYGWNGTDNEGCRMLASEVAKEIRRIENSKEFFEITGGKGVNKGPADTSIFNEENNMCIATDMRREGVGWTKADKRPGSRHYGLEKLRRYLKNAMSAPMEEPGLLVFSTCRHFIRTVPNLPRDSTNVEDVATNAEDHCFDGETKVITDSGIYRIADLVGKTGFILTVGGYHAGFNHCRMTREAVMNRVTFDDGTSVDCTTDQKFLSKSGWVLARNLLDYADEARYGVLSFKNKGEYLCEPKLSATLFRDLMGEIITSVDIITKTKGIGSTETFGSIIMGKYLTDARYTMEDLIEALIKLRIWNYSPSPNTDLCTPSAMTIKNGWPLCTTGPESGTEAMLEKNGTRNNTRNTVKIRSTNVNQENANSVTKNFKESPGRFFAQMDAKRKIGGRLESISSKRFAFGVENLLSRRNTITSALVREAAENGSGYQKKAISVESLKPGKTYCMNVENTHCFALENGVIVSNCYDEVRYRLSHKRYMQREQAKYK